MTVYAGIDVHRKRSRVAVLEPDGKERFNRNVPNGSPELVGLLEELPAGTPVAFEAAYGWWLLELLEDCELAPHLAHPSRCKAIALARLKDDRVDAVPWRSCCVPICCPRRGSPLARCGSCGGCCATGWCWCGCGPRRRTGSTRSSPIMAWTASTSCGAARDGPDWPGRSCRRRRG